MSQSALELVSKEEVKNQLQTHSGTEDVGVLTLAETFVRSGLWPDLKTASEAAVKILIARDIGITPAQAMQQIYIFKGKIGYQSGIIATCIKRSGKYNYKVKELTDERCTLEFYERFETGGPMELSGSYTFTMKDAIRAGFTSNSKYKELPSQMLFYKATALGARIYCPDVMGGGYDIEELRSMPEPEPKPDLKSKVQGMAAALKPAPQPEPEPQTIDAELVTDSDHRAWAIAKIKELATEDRQADLSSYDLEALDLLRAGDPGEDVLSTKRLSALLANLEAL